MVGPVRFEPPDLLRSHVARDRLVERLERRWTCRLVTIVGGPGFGKTSLLADAVGRTSGREARVDVWLTCEPGDSSDAALLAGLGRSLGIGAVDLDALCRTVWLHAPAQVCLVLDDAHEIRDGSSGAQVVARLLRELPRNGHVLVSSRSIPTLPLARLAARGQLERITEADLVFTRDELAEFAERRGLDPRALDATGGWPALVELTAAAGDLVGDYVWDEVLRTIGEERARHLARLSVVGAADDEIVAEAIGDVGGIAGLTDGIPLVRWADDPKGRWAGLHPLWAPVLRPLLTEDEAADVRRTAAVVHRRRRRYDHAVDLLADAGAWDELLATVRDAALHYGAFEEWHRFARWRRLLPDHVDGHPVARLAAGIETAAVVPEDGAADFESAAAGFRQMGDVAGELVAIQKHGLVAWWSNDVLTLLTLSERARELAAAGHAAADVVARIGRAGIAHASGEPDLVLELLAPVDLATAGEWVGPVGWLRTVAHRRRGDLARARRALDEAGAFSAGDVQLAIAGARVAWLQGRVDGVAAVLQGAADHYRLAKNRYLEVESTLELAARRAWLGDVRRARALLDDLGPDLQATPGALAHVLLGIATAASLVDAGDEEAAAEMLAAAPEAAPGTAESWYWCDRAAVSLVHVLRPADRDGWAREAAAPVHRTGVELARALIAARSGDREAVARLAWPSSGLARAHLPLAWLAELAAAGTTAGNPPPHDLVTALVAAGRPLAEGTEAARPRHADPPPHPAELLVLGPVRITRADGIVDHPDLRRRRVRELLVALALRRAQRRDEIAELLWPNTADPRHNLRVTLGYLQRLLRKEGLGASLVSDQQSIQLVPNPWLRCDLWSFEAALEDAEHAERESDPARALNRYGEALPLWRGEPFADLVDIDWIRDEQTRLRRRYVDIAVRAGQLHLAAGDPHLAIGAAERALTADPYDEPAHVLLVRAHLASGNEPRARRAADACVDALADLGVAPTGPTAELFATITAAPLTPR